MIFGINDGIYYLLNRRYLTNPSEIKEIVDCGCNAVELRVDGGIESSIVSLEEKAFIWKSFHLMNMQSFSEKEKKNYLDMVVGFVEKYNVDNVVFHANRVKDLSFLSEYPNIPWSVENLSLDDSCYKYPNDFNDIFQRYPNLKMTLDLQHVETVDRSMKLLDDFWNSYGDRVVEFHVSRAVGSMNMHRACFSFSDNIFKSFLKGKDIPVIIESVCERDDDLYMEIECVRGMLLD